MNPEHLKILAERIRSSGVLGRSELMQRLFDFLVECSAAGKVPKEIELAIDVFGKDADFEVAHDAMVRVYMHKLRKKLEEYYADAGRNETVRLTVPRGEYRLVFEESPAPIEATSTETLEPAVVESLLAEQEVPAPPAVPTRFAHWRTAAAIGAVLIAVNLLGWILFAANHSHGAHEVNVVRNNPLWHDMINDDLPIYIVVGDYYIFGELDAHSETSPESVQRLVREFNINSRNDLEQWLKDRPELERRYMDLALRYLPTSSAFALQNVVPLLEPNSKNPGQVQTILASELTPSMIRSSHIVYVGLLSGMGILRDIAFAGSQFKIGETYDELIDRKSNRTYVSQSSVSINDNTRYRDYGYFSTFAGPNGNRIVILAGTRDVAMMHTAEAVSHPQTLATLTQQSHAEKNFEALYAVDAIDRMNLNGKLLLTDKIESENVWRKNTVAVVGEEAHARTAQR
jgi:hypothetical protein